MNIILASKSKRRHKLLKSLKIDFTIVDSNFDTGGKDQHTI